jgi:hypothetical protein
MPSRKFVWDPEHWRFVQRKLARLLTKCPTTTPGRSCGALPTTTIVSLSLPMSNSPLMKEERLAIDASPGWWRCPTAYQINLFPPQIVA